ncbi:hypothetical protein SteCoe_35903 [Stentor coeruleus]|uniref:Rab-GAP TBC domain-containing protein n=1 Tax=Stentor coeruleus TaxID=5963 RepID=A0A1R2AR96_9CILI|nr:hypothetical protein SteCoe_35903 [Stentor coeruleus]
MEIQYHKISEKRSKPFTQREWEMILKHNDYNNVSKKRLKDSLICGVPSDLRGEIWTFLTRANQLSVQFSNGVYKKLHERIADDISNQIDRDLHRTFPEHRIFQERDGIGQMILKNILCAYANYDPEVGYCQGMGFIVGCLILQIRNEELSFWAFVQIMHDFNWRLIFKNGTPRLITMMKIMKKEVKKRFPDLHQHFEEQDLQLLACFSQYFITVFLYDTPTNIGIRIFDVFLLEGERVLFDLLYRMLAFKKVEILELKSQDLYMYLRKKLVKECFEEFSLGTLFSTRRQEEREMNEI